MSNAVISQIFDQLAMIFFFIFVLTDQSQQRQIHIVSNQQCMLHLFILSPYQLHFLFIFFWIMFIRKNKEMFTHAFAF